MYIQPTSTRLLKQSLTQIPKGEETEAEAALIASMLISRDLFRDEEGNLIEYDPKGQFRHCNYCSLPFTLYLEKLSENQRAQQKSHGPLCDTCFSCLERKLQYKRKTSTCSECGDALFSEGPARYNCSVMFPDGTVAVNPCFMCSSDAIQVGGMPVYKYLTSAKRKEIKQQACKGNVEVSHFFWPVGTWRDVPSKFVSLTPKAFYRIKDSSSEPPKEEISI